MQVSSTWIVFDVAGFPVRLYEAICNHSPMWFLEENEIGQGFSLQLHQITDEEAAALIEAAKK